MAYATSIVTEVARLPLLRALLVARGARASARAAARPRPGRGRSASAALLRPPARSSRRAGSRSRSRRSGSGSPAPRGRAVRRNWSRRRHDRRGRARRRRRLPLQPGRAPAHPAVAGPVRSTTRTGSSTSACAPALSLTIGLGVLPVIGGLVSLRLPDRRGDPTYRAFAAWTGGRDRRPLDLHRRQGGLPLDRPSPPSGRSAT